MSIYTRRAELPLSTTRLISGGDVVNIRFNEFLLYDDNNQPVPASGDEVIDGLLVSGTVINTSTPYTLTVIAKKHINSTSLAQDNDSFSGVKNTGVDDMSEVSKVEVIGTITGSRGSFPLYNCILYSFPSMWPPNIDISRLRMVLRSTGSDYYSLFTNANINKYGGSLVDKLPPYSIDKCIGYTPNYHPVYMDKLDNRYTTPMGHEGYYTVNVPYFLNEGTLVSTLRVLNSTKSTITNSGFMDVVLRKGNNSVVHTYTINGVEYEMHSSYSVEVIVPVSPLTIISAELVDTTATLTIQNIGVTTLFTFQVTTTYWDSNGIIKQLVSISRQNFIPTGTSIHYIAVPVPEAGLVWSKADILIYQGSDEVNIYASTEVLPTHIVPPPVL